MMKITAFIFDLDGVITDTVELHFQSWKRLTEEENIPFSREDNEQLRGLTRHESLKRILKNQPVVDEATANRWMEQKNRYFGEYLNKLTPNDILPGVYRFLHEAQSSGIMLGLGSSSKNARAVLKRLELLEMFAVIGDGYSVENGKPSPDIFLWTAQKLGILAHEAVVFEDSAVGIEAALSAGFWTVGIGTTDAVSRAHFVTPSLESITVDKLIQRFSALQ